MALQTLAPGTVEGSAMHSFHTPTVRGDPPLPPLFLSPRRTAATLVGILEEALKAEAIHLFSLETRMQPDATTAFLQKNLGSGGAAIPLSFF